MDSIINKLTEIEEAASAIVRHAEEKKAELDKEYDEKRRKFDSELESRTQERLRTIREELERSTSGILESQNDASAAAILAMQKEYEERHTEYAREILRRITEV